MAISLVQKADNDSSESYVDAASSLTLYFDSPTTSGNALVAGFGAYDSSTNPVLTFSDSETHSWNRPVHEASSSNGRSTIGYVLGITGGSSAWVRITPGEASDLQGKAVELSGVGAYEDNNSNNGSAGGTVGPGSVTAAIGDFMYARMDDEDGDPGSATWSGSTELGNSAWSASNYLIATSAGGNSPTWTLDSGDDWAAGIARFSAAGAAVLPPGLAGLRGHRRRAQVMRRR